MTRSAPLPGLVFVPLLCVAGCCCGPEPEPPRPPGCTPTAGVVVDEVVVGYRLRTDRVFRPSPPGGSLAVERGFQGTSMTRFAVGFRSASTATCVAATITESYSADQGFRVRRDGDFLVTDDLYIVPTSAPSLQRLTVTSSGQRVSGGWTPLDEFELGSDAGADGGPGPDAP